MGKTIKVSQEFLNSPQIAEIFSSDVGKQLYLHIGSAHLRSQYFNDTVLKVARHIEGMKERPQTVEEMRLVLRTKGQGDPAIYNAFPRPGVPAFYSKVQEGSSSNWESWNRKIDEAKAKYQASVDEADAHIMELVDAINGRNPWNYETV